MRLTHRPDPALADRRVLVVGIGGLGAPAAAALAAAGVGTLGLIDPDRVDASNLPRQTLYADADVGLAKVEVAAARLAERTPGLRTCTTYRRFTADDVALAAAYDALVDGTDSIAAKFAVNDAAVAAGRPLVHAAVLGWRAQLTTILPGATACYRCVFEDAPPPGDVPSCQDAGVVGATTALAAAIQAAEVVRLLTGSRPALAGRLLTIDLSTGLHRTIPLARRPACPACARTVTARSVA
jgi:adenylyltransferase/sulfurtransferase